MSRVLEICLTLLAVAAVAAATVGTRQEMARAPEGTFPLQMLDPMTTSAIGPSNVPAANGARAVPSSGRE